MGGIVSGRPRRSTTTTSLVNGGTTLGESSENVVRYPRSETYAPMWYPPFNPFACLLTYLLLALPLTSSSELVTIKNSNDVRLSYCDRSPQVPQSIPHICIGMYTYQPLTSINCSCKSLHSQQLYVSFETIYFSESFYRFLKDIFQTILILEKNRENFKSLFF